MCELKGVLVAAATGAAEVGPRGHVVQFYRRDEELADQAGAYLAGALHDDGVAISIATREHRQAFEARLAAAGVDVPAARARGDYLAVDAEELLPRLMTTGRPDAASFNGVACSLIEEPAAHGRSVRVYGELVAVLWDAGLMTAAVELEEMWVGLGRQFPFALWCGYRTEPSAGDLMAAGIAEVCRLHGEIVGYRPPGAEARVGELSRDFAWSLDSIGPARRFVVAALEAGGHGVVADDAALVVTEFAVNAVLHARSPFTVTITPGEDRVRIGVRDCAALPGSGNGQVLPVAPLHGLSAVAAMAVRWGATPTGSGKDVWAELPR
ncbi:MAG TPA: MEDS domain-containing protein [Streptosporangiaceae bacterium]|nr:MEDS domain-containing protein [Streptosporangiaceae bacterium]